MDYEIHQILQNLTQKEEAQVLQEYIKQLQTSIDDLTEQNDELSSDNDNMAEEIEDLENDINDLENEIEDLKTDTTLVDYIKEIVDDRYKYIVPTYDTKEKILDRLEFLLKYGV